jgi:hypothetical protein
METTPHSSGERHIEKIMEELDPTSERYQVLDTAKRFKSSWVELGDKLLRVSSGTMYREWGYQSFEEYCVQEIRIRKQTAEKLTLAYRFMEKHEPALLERREDPRPLPDFRTVDLLRQAREEKGFSDEEYATLRKSAVEEERSHPTVLKRFKEVTSSRGDVLPDPATPLKTTLAAARRLETLLSDVANLPGEYGNQLAGLIGYLEGELKKVLTTPES